MEVGELVAEQTSGEKNLGMPRLISNLFHPFLVGPAAFLYFSLAYTDRIAFGMLVWFITFLATNVVIGLYVFFMKRRGETVSVDVPERGMRRKPFMVGTVGYVVASVVLLAIGAPRIVWALMAIYAVNTAIATFISHWWKISIHGMSVGGTIVPFLYLYGGLWWLATLVLPAMVYSRVKLKAHSVSQAVMGIVLAFVLTWIELKLWL
ncbi:MAG: hypothetical protein K9N46_09350 [Candidatus Marinimicrobia bacterium]|nr:hypothetical protein [Candidatus Neomarinimicrobiota bacterium]MCF7829444.1 hypothetical protein [Candidatus Neomarinimicrobiota bacterium]MCF7880930.1 hypothetical protein [Candidatus Neomarinimicrobiota bacterium]